MPNNDLISLSELLKFPIRADHYDKENGNEHFIYGIETVLEYAQNLPRVDAEPMRYEEAEKLRADNTYIAKKFSNYLMNTTGGRISNPFLDDDEIQKVFVEAFEEEVNKRIAAETKKNARMPSYYHAVHIFSTNNCMENVES